MGEVVGAVGGKQAAAAREEARADEAKHAENLEEEHHGLPLYFKLDDVAKGEAVQFAGWGAAAGAVRRNRKSSGKE